MNQRLVSYREAMESKESYIITRTSEWSVCGEQMSCGRVGIFHESEGRVK